MSKARRKRERGQAIIELALQIPIMMLLLFGVFQVARVYYVYHTLQKAVRGGAGLLSRSANVDYCAADATLADARNFIVYGNLQGEGLPIMLGLTSDMIQILPERELSDSTTVTQCSCLTDADGCALSSGGRAPDFVAVKLSFPLPIPFPFVQIPALNLNVSARMPVTGG
jgi:hypothetical protein